MSTPEADAPKRRGRPKKVADTAPTSMKELKDTLWKAADKLRGSMDASQYKDVILGLIFLKYVSDAFEERRNQIAAELRADGFDEEQIEPLLDDVDEYTGAGVFWIEPDARWQHLADHAKQGHIGLIIDQAMDLIMSKNDSLKNTLPKGFNREGVDQNRLGQLIDIFNNVRFTGEGASKARDLLGEVYEYFLEKFASAEGKRGGEFYTPASVVRVLVEVLEPTTGRVYDPCCGSGGMFVQTEKFIEAHGNKPQAVSVYGQELNERTWRMAKMNLAIHGIGANLGPVWGDTFARDLHPDIKADFVMANPPFNIKDWARNENDGRWRFGVPPAGNANYAWIQHIISHLAPGGRAGVVMANGSMSTNSGGEGQIRAQIVEADLVSCMIALPTQLFRSVGIPVCVWILAKDKEVGQQGSTDRTGEILFIDARNLGFMVDRAERSLDEADIAKIANTYHSWRGTSSAAGRLYADERGFCASIDLQTLKEADYSLTPGQFVGAPVAQYESTSVQEEIERLEGLLENDFRESERLAALVQKQIARLR
jgi:type I restriction enzyme M protein